MRIVPPYLVAVGLVLGVGTTLVKAGGPGWRVNLPIQFQWPAQSPGLVGNVISHMTFTHGFFEDFDRSLDGAFWSLATEWQFYLVFPLVALVMFRRGSATAVALCFVVPVLYVLCSYATHPELLSTAVGGDLIALRLVDFGAGIGVAHALARGWRVRGLGSMTLLAIGVALTVERVHPAALSPFAWAAAFGGVVWFAAGAPSVRQVLASRVLRWFGRYSYSLYLVHGSVLLALTVLLTQPAVSESSRLLGIIVLGPPLAVVASVMLGRAVEQPAIGWARAACAAAAGRQKPRRHAPSNTEG